MQFQSATDLKSRSFAGKYLLPIQSAGNRMRYNLMSAINGRDHRLCWVVFNSIESVSSYWLDGKVFKFTLYGNRMKTNVFVITFLLLSLAASPRAGPSKGVCIKKIEQILTFVCQGCRRINLAYKVEEI